MSATVRELADPMRALPRAEFDGFLSWLAQTELDEEKAWSDSPPDV